jgi:dihydrofolate reductase
MFRAGRASVEWAGTKSGSLIRYVTLLDDVLLTARAKSHIFCRADVERLLPRSSRKQKLATGQLEKPEPRETTMRKLIVSQFITLDGVIQAPGGQDEDRDNGFTYGGWTLPYWHDDIGSHFFTMMKNVDALLLGRRTYVTHAEAFEPMPAGNPFGDMMNAPAKYVVSKTLQSPKWRNTTIIRGDVVNAVLALKAQPGKNIATDGSSQLVHMLLADGLVDELHLLLYPLAVGGGKRLFPDGKHSAFTLTGTTTYPTGVVGLHYTREPA